MKKINLLLTLLIISISSFAQKKFYLETGVGIPEGYHVGVGYQYATFGGFDFKYGSDLKPFDSNGFHLLTITHALYFGKIRENVERKLWSFNIGFTTYFANNSHVEGYEMLLSGYFAREFVITRKFLVQPGLGVFQRVNNQLENKDGHIDGDVILLPVYPKFNLSLIFDV
jgi:hypothetical protein